jgi:hypothetical protein
MTQQPLNKKSAHKPPGDLLNPLNPDTALTALKARHVLKDLEEKNPTEISILTNSGVYSLEIVFIAIVKQGFRLIVIYKRKLLTDKIYKTSRGARAAFARQFKPQTTGSKVKAKWSGFFPPVIGWIDKKKKVSRKSPRTESKNPVSHNKTHPPQKNSNP